jgi:hypothetical protein
VGETSFASDQVMSATTMSHVQLIPTSTPPNAAKSPSMCIGPCDWSRSIDYSASMPAIAFTPTSSSRQPAPAWNGSPAAKRISR